MTVIPLVISFFSVISLGGGVWTTVRVIQIKLYVNKPELHWPALVWFLAAFVSDVLITVVLVSTLSRRKTGFVGTDDAISKIIQMTVQTGLLTTFLAIGDVVFFMTLPHTSLNFLWDLALSKIYSICLLSTLNARVELNENILNDNQTRYLDDNSHLSLGSMFSYPQSRSIECGITVTQVTTPDPLQKRNMQ